MNRLEEKLKSENLRLTTPRKIIFDILRESETALSAQEVCDKMNDSIKFKADQASVYRNLSLFSKLGLVHRFQSGKYSLCQHGPKYSHDHMHIVANCSHCGKTYEVQKHGEGLCQLAGQFKNFIEEFNSFSGVTLQGRCKNCSRV